MRKDRLDLVASERGLHAKRVYGNLTRQPTLPVPQLRVCAVLVCFFSLLAAAGFLIFVTSVAAQAQPKVLAIHFSLDINPVSQDYVNHQIDEANSGGYSAIVILLDTPGGLSTSMEKIYEKILVSRVPVIVYVSPTGSGSSVGRRLRRPRRRTCSRWRRRRTSAPPRRSTRAAATSEATCAAR